MDIKMDDINQTTCCDIGHCLKAVTASETLSEPTNPVEPDQTVLSDAQIRSKSCVSVGKSTIGPVN
jgi:hypothetical protein